MSDAYTNGSAADFLIKWPFDLGKRAKRVGETERDRERERERERESGRGEERRSHNRLCVLDLTNGKAFSRYPSLLSPTNR